jgi:hypothetical protein
MEAITIDPPRTQEELWRFVEDTMQIDRVYRIMDRSYPYRSMAIHSEDDGEGGIRYYWSLSSRSGTRYFSGSGRYVQSYKTIGGVRKNLFKTLQWVCR